MRRVKYTLGQFIAGIYLDVGEGLVILEADVVAGMMALNQVQLQDERFLLGAGDKEIDVGNVGDHPLIWATSPPPKYDLTRLRKLDALPT